jgi:hypothetical protein
MKDILICDCNSPEHQLIICKENDDVDSPICYMLIHLNKRSFLKRLVYGFKYICGRQSNYGAFDEFIFNPEDASKLQEVVNHLTNGKNN